MNIQTKLKQIEEKINFAFNQPKIFFPISRAEGIEYENKIFPDIETFKKEVKFNPRNDLFRIIEFV